MKSNGAARPSWIGRLRDITRGGAVRTHLMRGGMGAFLLQGANLLLVLGVAVVMARVLGAERYGVYAFVLAVISLLSIPAQFGLPTLVVRETAKFQVHEDWARMRGIWVWSTRVVVVFVIAIALVIALAGWLVAWLADYKVSAAYFCTFLWGMLLMPLLALGTLRGAALRGLRHPVLGMLPEKVVIPGLLIVFMVSAALLADGGEPAPQVAMMLHVLAACCAFGLGAWLLVRHRPALVRAGYRPVFESKAWWSATLPLALLSGLQVVNKNTDLVMLGLFRAAGDVGVYKIVAQGGALISFGLGVANTVIAPYLSRFHTQGDRARLQRLLTASAWVILVFALIALAVFIAFGEWILVTIFGAAFTRGYVPLVILCLGQLANAAFGSVGLLLNMTGYERDAVRGLAAGALVNVTLNLLLIPPFGLEGAAIATAVSLLVWNLVLWRQARSRLSVNTAVFGRIEGV